MTTRATVPLVSREQTARITSVPLATRITWETESVCACRGVDPATRAKQTFASLLEEYVLSAATTVNAVK